jgi:signal peptidase I
MAPALRDGQWMIVERAAYRLRGPERFDIVRFRDPSRPGSFSVKRVTGLPGERVKLESGRLMIDGRPVVEPASVQISEFDFDEWQTGPEEYVLLGDNRAASTDSRAYGAVQRKAILGRVRTTRARPRD